MKQLVGLYLGALAMVGASYLGLVQLPRDQLAETAEYETERGIYPDVLWGDIRKGRAQYISLGCIYCHSQQVRPRGFGADLRRGWGDRRTRSVDYRYDNPPLLGTMRTGPDLAAIGARQPSPDWHYLHLYDPQITSPGSNMAPFPFLFDVTTEPPPGALKVELRSSGGETTWLVPEPEAVELVTYLLYLDKTVPSWPRVTEVEP